MAAHLAAFSVGKTFENFPAARELFYVGFQVDDSPTSRSCRADSDAAVWA